ncbi:claudin-4-like [Conger conger]|uniref:claudin-4-like n=1 Tax=Conger conger TaxID=82655 RepID=UPI002A5A5830|nr:claudin-4-like [Conger conger]
MGVAGVQMVCVFLGILGLVAGIVCCAVPKWKESSFSGQNIVTAQVTQDGLWMSCVVQSTGQQQCKSYDSLLILSADLQAARAMTIISCLLSCLSVLLLLAGARFTTCMRNEAAKPRATLAAGVGLILAGVLLLIPVSWSAHNVIRAFRNPLNPQKKELGACIFVGWAGSLLLLLAGGLLCCFSRPGAGGGSPNGNAKYYSNGASAPAPAKDYV